MSQPRAPCGKDGRGSAGFALPDDLRIEVELWPRIGRPTTVAAWFRRVREGPTRAYLLVIKRNPRAVQEALRAA